MKTQNRLLIYFGLIAACGATGFVVMWLYGFPVFGIQGIYSSEYLRSINLVEALADKEQNTFERWVGGHRRELSLLSSSEFFSSAVAELKKKRGAERALANAELQRQLQAFHEASPETYAHLYVINPSNRQILAASDSQFSKVPAVHEAFLEDAAEPGLSEAIHIAGNVNDASLMIVNQIAERDRDGAPTGAINGIVVASLKLGAPFLNDGLSMRQKLGLSGEILLVNQDGHAIFRSSLEGNQQESDFVADVMVSGTEGVKLLKTPSGAELITVFRHLHLGASEGLSLVVVRSTKEALAEIQNVFFRLASLGVVAFLLIMGLVMFAAKRIAKAETENIYLEFHDPLTGLPNRRLMQDRVQQTIATYIRNRHYFALLFIDLDHFKKLNDTLGHDKGDLLLQQVAQRLTHCVRKGDTIARLGGDEFLVLLGDLSPSLGKALAEAESTTVKIITALNQPYQLAGQAFNTTVSIGITLPENDHQSVEDLRKQADIAMYQAKEAGRNTYRFFNVKMQEQISVRATLEKDLRLAIEEQQFLLYFQPQAHRDRKIIGAEVLLRWKHPERGLVSPLEFIPLIEENGMILPIGQWVLETACACLKKWQDHSATKDLQLAVNVSAHQFSQPDFVDQVRQVVQKFSIDSKLLKLEITESMVLKDVADTISKMKMLRSEGIRFSMDDFGTGYSSLSSLKKLPLDQLKIDQSFVRDISSDQDGAVIIQTIIAMATNLDMEIIAEGVETEDQLDFLYQHNCFLYQGYLFSRPLPLEQFEALL